MVTFFSKEKNMKINKTILSTMSIVAVLMFAGCKNGSGASDFAGGTAKNAELLRNVGSGADSSVGSPCMIRCKATSAVAAGEVVFTITEYDAVNHSGKYTLKGTGNSADIDESGKFNFQKTVTGWKMNISDVLPSQLRLMEHSISAGREVTWFTKKRLSDRNYAQYNFKIPETVELP